MARDLNHLLFVFLLEQYSSTFCSLFLLKTTKCKNLLLFPNAYVYLLGRGGKVWQNFICRLETYRYLQIENQKIRLNFVEVRLPRSHESCSLKGKLEQEMVSVFKNQFFFFNLKFSINSKKAFLAIIVVPLYVQGILRALFCLISPLRASMTCNTISCACYLVHLLFSV